jgi:hypothetical protein
VCPSVAGAVAQGAVRPSAPLEGQVAVTQNQYEDIALAHMKVGLGGGPGRGEDHVCSVVVHLSTCRGFLHAAPQAVTLSWPHLKLGKMIFLCIQEMRVNSGLWATLALTVGNRSCGAGTGT